MNKTLAALAGDFSAAICADWPPVDPGGDAAGGNATASIRSARSASSVLWRKRHSRQRLIFSAWLRYAQSPPCAEKRDEIIAVIKLYERQLEQARADRAHVLASMQIFDSDADVKPYVDIHHMFKRTEKIVLCREALADGRVSTKPKPRSR